MSNDKTRKALACKVTPEGGDTFYVLSPSGRDYVVRLADGGASAYCTCPYGKAHPAMATEKGCSHALAVWLFLQGRHRNAR
jgi:predicted nucleic acid-binding Zn finger protein